jgi:GAF domain
MKEPLRICELCVQGLGVSGCGISMVTRTGNRAVVCATDDVAAQLEDLQFTLGEGPGVEAIDTGVPVLIDDVSEAADRPSVRWPAFTQAAASAGARAVFAFPMRVGPLRLGALDFYRVEPGSLSPDQVSGALLAAKAAAISLLHLDATAEDAFDDDRTTRASYQMQVHQATGMVKVQVGGSVEDALAILRAHAFAAEISIAQIARDVVERRLRFTSENL